MALVALLDLPAPAKLNLFLHVVGKRADGYHLLQSPFVLIDWCDTVHVERRADGMLRRHDLGPSLPADDLCLKAARTLQSASGCALGADISVMKRIPAGAGLGGGSSDAATTLLALNRLWGLGWPRGRLLQLAAGIGADVPFFVGGDNAFVEGIGERLTPLALPQAWYAVVKPPQSLPTQAIFADPSLERHTEAVILSGSLDDAKRTSEPIEGWTRGWGRNDLQPPAESRCPGVAQAAAWLHGIFGNSRMTGSGSAVFARAGTEDQPLATMPVPSTVSALGPGWQGRMCRSLPGHPLAAWAGESR